MGDHRAFVIVGAGLAGARAAASLRTEGFEGRVVLLGEEPVRPYDRVPLSKYYLHGEPGHHRLFIHDEGYYADHDIELRLDARAVSIDPGGGAVVLASDERVGYDRLLLATGAQPRQLSVPGADLDGVHHLRRVADADRLRDALGVAERLVVVGAGFLGCEVAASARQLGIDVALVGSGDLPMERALGTAVARFYRDLHAARGVALYPGAEVEAFRGDGVVEEVVLADGRVLAADAVVVGVGAQPRVELARSAGLVLDGGIVTDEYLATSNPDIFAAGDVAAARHPALGRRLRLEHWSSALNQGPTAARNMVGVATPYDRVPFFFTDQYQVWMEYTGYAAHGAELVLRGDPTMGESAEFLAFWLREGRLVAGMNVNIKGVPDTMAALVRSGGRLDPHALADPRVDLKGLLPPR